MTVWLPYRAMSSRREVGTRLRSMEEGHLNQKVQSLLLCREVNF